MSESSSAELSAFTHAGFVNRVFAATIDLLVLAVPLAVFISFLSVAMGISTAFLNLRPGEAPKTILLAFGNRFLLITLAFFILMSWLYFAISESSVWRATLGKRLLGLHVADLSGDRVRFGRATMRFLFGRLLLHMPYIGIYYFLIDGLCAAVTQRKQAFHDVLSGCLVLGDSAPNSST